VTRTIDLGLVGTDRPGVDGAGRPRPPWRRTGPVRPAWVAARRWTWWPAAALAAALLAASGSAPPASSPSGTLVPLFTIPAGDRAALTDQHLYVVGVSREHRTDVVTVTAYRVDDAAEQWQHRSPSSGQLAVPPSVAVQAGVVLLHTIRFWPDRDRRDQVGRMAGPSRTTVALNPDTGQVRWAYEGIPAGMTAGRILLDNVDTGEEAADRYRLVALDARTGREQWSLQLSGFSTNDGYRLAALDLDGTLTVHDLASGAPLARTSVPVREEFARLLLVGSVVLVDTAQPEQREVTAYDRDTLTHVWTATVTGALEPCAGLLCVADAGVVYAIDPATGQAAWPPLSPDPGTRTLAGVSLPDGRHVLLASIAVGGSTWVVDVRTGQPVRELTGWRPVGDGTSPAGPPRVPGTGGSEPTPLLYHLTRDGTWLGRLDPRALEIDVLGVVGDIVPAWCTPGGGHVACRIPDDPERMRVWRIAER
jgi:outer membrane protein assembly factor BamB